MSEIDLGSFPSPKWKPKTREELNSMTREELIAYYGSKEFAQALLEHMWKAKKKAIEDNRKWDEEHK